VFTLLTALAMPLLSTFAINSLENSIRDSMSLQSADLESSYSLELPSNYAIFYAPDTPQVKAVMANLATNYPSIITSKGSADETFMMEDLFKSYDSLKLDTVEFAGVLFDKPVSQNASSVSYQIWYQEGLGKSKSTSLFVPALQVQLDRAIVQLATGTSSLQM
jgi:hypothetical protein